MTATKTESEMKELFWEQLSASPFVMLELDGAPQSAAPMTAQLDKEAHGVIWFFTTRDGAFGRMGPATATFAAKGHKLFARFSGRLVEEKSSERLDKLWSNPVAAWFPEGKTSPSVLLMRMELGNASIWSAEMEGLALPKMLLGLNVRNEMKGHHAHTRL
jgi:general stress protein 26